jgi:hypothetical protein
MAAAYLLLPELAALPEAKKCWRRGGFEFSVANLRQHP